MAGEKVLDGKLFERLVFSAEQTHPLDIGDAVLAQPAHKRLKLFLRHLRRDDTGLGTLVFYDLLQQVMRVDTHIGDIASRHLRFRRGCDDGNGIIGHFAVEGAAYDPRRFRIGPVDDRRFDVKAVRLFEEQPLRSAQRPDDDQRKKEVDDDHTARKRGEQLRKNEIEHAEKGIGSDMGLKNILRILEAEETPDDVIAFEKIDRADLQQRDRGVDQPETVKKPVRYLEIETQFV